MKRFFTPMALILIFCAGFLVDSIDFDGPQVVILTQAEAYVHGSHRRVARRTSRRTARRVSSRHSYYRAPGVVYGAGAVAATATAVAIGTRVVTLPPVCSNITVYGRPYYHCGGTYYQPLYDGPDVVYVVVDNPN